MRPLFLPLLLLAVGAALLGGCSGDTDARDTGPSVVATGPHPSSPSPSATSASPLTSPSASPSTGGAAAVPAACAPYATMVTAIEDAARHSTDPEEIAAAIAPVMKRFAAQVPDLPRPPGMSAATWAGVVALAAQIRTLPAHPTSADIDAVQQRLGADQRRAVETAADWFRSSCGL